MSRPRKRRGKGRVGRCHLQSCPLGTSKKPKAGSRPKAKKRGKSQKCGYRILRLKCAHSTDKKGERAAVGFRYAADAGHELPVFWSVVAGDTAKHADKLRVELDEIIGACENPNHVGVMAARLGQRGPWRYSPRGIELAVTAPKVTSSVLSPVATIVATMSYRPSHYLLAIGACGFVTGKRASKGAQLLHRSHLPKGISKLSRKQREELGLPNLTPELPRRLHNPFAPTPWFYATKNDAGVYGLHIVNVFVYPRDKYKFELRLAPSRVSEKKSTKTRMGKVAYQQEVSQKAKKLKTTTSVHGEPTTKDEDVRHLAAARNSIKIIRDGANVELEVGTFLSRIVGIRDNLAAVQKRLNALPKIGWYVDWNATFLHGGLDLEWGYRETVSRPTVYSWWKLTAQFTLFSGTITAGWGVKLWRFFEARAYMLISGSVVVKASLESGSPDKPSKKKTAELVGKIEGGVGLMAAVLGGYIYSYKRELKGGFEFKLCFVSHQKPSGFLKSKWTGVSGEIVKTYLSGYTTRVKAPPPKPPTDPTERAKWKKNPPLSAEHVYPTWKIF